MTEQTRRISDPILAQLLAEIQTLSDKITSMDGIFRSHVHDEELNLRETAKLLSEVRAGFPDNDPEAHCREHAEGARRMKEKADFWRRLNFELAKYGLLGFFGWAVYALWKAFLLGPK